MTAIQGKAAETDTICDYSVGMDGLCQIRTDVALIADRATTVNQLVSQDDELAADLLAEAMPRAAGLR